MMRVFNKKDIEIKQREDGRTCKYYPALDIPANTKQIGLISVDTPMGCKEDLHVHPESKEIFFHLTPGKVEINGEIYKFEAGDVVILEPGDRHKQIADENIRILGLRIPLSADKEIL